LLELAYLATELVQLVALLSRQAVVALAAIEEPRSEAT
jgi:hypothetical protein